jgi:hypothetical protein
LEQSSRGNSYFGGGMDAATDPCLAFSMIARFSALLLLSVTAVFAQTKNQLAGRSQRQVHLGSRGS